MSGVSRRLSSPTFIGRERERDQVREALQAAAGGQPAAVLVGGEAGVGKTRLTAEVATDAIAGGWRVLIGHCLELGASGLPFAPIVEALRELPRELDPAVLDRVLGPARDELGQLVPTLAGRAAIAPGAALDDRSQARLFELLHGALGRLADDRPLVLVVEDLHWADRSTRDLWLFLCRNIRRGSCLLVATFRTDELHRRHPLLPLLAELQRLANVVRIDLARFVPSELSGQLAGILGRSAPGELARRIYERSDGNPFFAEELLAAEAAGEGETHSNTIPVDLQTVLMERVARLSEETQGVLRVAAVVGRDVPHATLAHVVDLPDPALLEALHEAVGQQIIVLNTDEPLPSYRFRHALIQEAVYNDLLPTERTVLHGRIADELLRRPEAEGETPAALAAEIAHHFYRGFDLPRALDWSVRAGDAASSVRAYAEAHVHYERALELWPKVADAEDLARLDRTDLLVLAAEAAASSAALTRAAALAREALDTLSPSGDQERRAIVSDRLFWYLYEGGDLDGAGRAIEAASESISPSGSTIGRSRVLTDLAHYRWAKGRYADAGRIAQEALELARAAGSDRDEGRALLLWGSSLAALGDLDRGIECLEAARVKLAEIGDEMATFAVVELHMALFWAGRHAYTVEVLSTELANVRRRGTERRYGPMLVQALWDSLTDLGRWAEADRYLAETPLPDTENRATAWLRECIAELAVLRGDIELAKREIAIAETVVGAGASEIDRVFVLRSIAAIARAEGRFDDARHAVDEAMAQSHDVAHDAPLWWLYALVVRSEADRVEAARARGRSEDVADAAAYAEHIVQLLTAAAAEAEREGRPVPTLRAYALHATAELGRLGGRSDPGAWAAAADQWAALSQPLDEAYAHFRTAEAILARGEDRSRAADLLNAAHAVAVRLGAAPLRKDAEALARRARIGLVAESNDRGRSDPVEAADPWGLTTREREVLAMLVDGRTNREIGAALFIAEKTASVHVSNIMGKLGVTSRGAAAALAARIALPPAARSAGDAASANS